MGDQGGRVLVGDGFLIGNSSRACCPSTKAAKTGSLVRDTNLHLQEFSRCCARGRARSGDLGSRPSPRFLLVLGFLPDDRMAGGWRDGSNGLGGISAALGRDAATRQDGAQGLNGRRWGFRA